MTAPDEIVVGISSAVRHGLIRASRPMPTACGLARLIFNGPGEGRPKSRGIADAAKSWTYKDRVYTFELVPDLKFHNGRPVSVEDLEFSFEQFRAGVVRPLPPSSRKSRKLSGGNGRRSSYACNGQAEAFYRLVFGRGFGDVQDLRSSRKSCQAFLAN